MVYRIVSTDYSRASIHASVETFNGENVDDLNKV